MNRGGGDEESKRVNKDPEEEHAGMSTDGAGSSGELGGTVSAIIGCHRVNGTLGNAWNFSTVLAPLPEYQPASKGKESRGGEDPAWGGWVLQSVWLGFRSSLGAVGAT